MDRATAKHLVEHGREINLEAWWAGREPFPGAGFTFADDRWNLAYRKTAATTWSACVLKFERLPSWLKDHVKRYITHLWLEEAYSNGTLRAGLAALVRLGEYVTRHHPRINHVWQLNGAVAEGLTAFYRTIACRQNHKQVQISRIRHFAEWLRILHHGKPADFRPDTNEFASSGRPRPYLDGEHWVIPDEVVDQIWRAIREAERDLSAGTKKPNHINVNSQMLALQLLKLLLATGRRISQLCLLARFPLREVRLGEAQGVWLRYMESKTDQGLQEVFVPDPLATEVRQAVKLAQDLTEAYAGEVDHLFVLPPLATQGTVYPVRPVTAAWFGGWLNGTTGKGAITGFLTRYGVQHNGQIYHLKPHQSRHTRLTKIRLGGGAYATAKNDAVHRSETMTGVYINSVEPVAKEIRGLASRRQLLGTLTPLIENKQAQVRELDEDDFALFQEQGMFIQLTAYGYCAQPVENGPCPSGDPCWLGPEGQGCHWHLYSPKSRAALEADQRATADQLNGLRRESPRSPQLEMWEKHLKRLQQLLAELGEAEDVPRG